METDGVLREAVEGMRTALIPSAGGENHASFVVQLSDGSMGCAWFAGTREGQRDVCIWFSRLQGDRWSEPICVSADDGRSHQNPVLAVLPGDTLQVLYTTQDLTGQASAFVLAQTSNDQGDTWTPAHEFRGEAGTFIRQPMIIDGERRLLPIFHCPPREGEWRGDVDTSSVLESLDSGNSWAEHAVPQSEGAVHMAIVRLSTGSWVGLFRSRRADRVHRAESADGVSWTSPTPTDTLNNNSSITCLRYPTTDAEDRLLMVCNPVGRGEDQVGDGAVWGLARMPLSVLTSTDGGETWNRLLDLETQPMADAAGLQARRHKGIEMSYPMMCSTADGDLHITYSWNRQCIKHVHLPADTVRSILSQG